MTRDELERRQRIRAVLQPIGGVVAVGCLVALVWMMLQLTLDRNTAQRQTSTLAERVVAACGSGGEAEDQLRAIGACQQASNVDGVDAVEPTADQVRALVLEYLDTRQPRDGKDGRPPTAAELDAAVQRFCGENRCRGPEGVNGADGTDGADGSDGADAPPVADDRLASQVAAYCERGDDPCRGPKGDDGKACPDDDGWTPSTTRVDDEEWLVCARPAPSSTPPTTTTATTPEGPR